MARGPKAGEPGAAGGVQWPDGGAAGDDSTPPPGPDVDLASMLASLGPDPEVIIERQEPHWCAGYTGGAWSVDSGDPVGFIERLAAELGGGVYLVRPLKRAPNGKKSYARGSIRVRIAGQPRHPTPTPHTPQQHAAPMIDVRPVREQPMPQRSELGMLADILGRFEQRLAGFEQRLATPALPPTPTSSGLDLVGELRKFAELRKLARELIGDGGRDDDDDNDDDDDDEPAPAPAQRLDPEALLGRWLETQVAPPAQQSPTQQSAPPMRLIRDGVDITPPQQHAPQQHAPQQHAPQQHAPQQHAPQQHAPASSAEAAAAVARKIGQMPPHEAVAFLAAVQASLPPETINAFQAAAMAQAMGGPPQQHDDDDAGDVDDDEHAQAFR